VRYPCRGGARAASGGPWTGSIHLPYIYLPVEQLYNPYDFDLMEFVGKNVAARRARGRYFHLNVVQGVT